MTSVFGKLSTGINGMPRAHLSASDGSSVEVYLNGATVVAWLPADTAQNVFFLSGQSAFEAGKPIRGGIPLAFPQFATDGPLPIHGLARTAQWTLASSGDGEAVFELRHDQLPAEHQQLWPAAFTLRYVLGFSSADFRSTLEVHNSGSAPLPTFAALLHTYYRLPGSLATVKIEGLGGCEYIDKMKNRERFRLPAATALTIESETDRIFPNYWQPDRPGPVELILTAEGIRPRHIAFGACIRPGAAAGQPGERPLAVDVVTWNPWIAKSKAMPDFGDEEYHYMVCIEPGCVHDKVENLLPGQVFALFQNIVLGTSDPTSDAKL